MVHVVTSQNVLNDKSPNPQDTTLGATIRTNTIVTQATYPPHFRWALLQLKGGIPSRITKAKQ